MTLLVGVDFDGNGWVDVYRESGDADNLFGAPAASPIDLERGATAGGFVVSSANNTDNSHLYGRNLVTLDSWNVGDKYAFGRSVTPTYTITNQPSGTYSAGIWVKAAIGKNVTLRLNLISTGGTTINGSPVVVSSGSWQRLTVSGSLPHAAQSIYIEVECTAVSLSGKFSFVGPMVVAGSTLPTYLNCGADAQYENITGYVLNARWRTGFVRPYQYIAATGRATITLSNWDKRFSPEAGHAQWTSDNLAAGNLLVRICDDTTVLWTGYVSEWKPQAGTGTEKRCDLVAEDLRAFYDGVEIFPDVQTSATPNTLISHIHTQMVKNGLDLWSQYEAVTHDLNAIETETVPYFFDQTANESDAIGQNPLSLLEDILKGIQAKYWISREGAIVYAGPDEDGGAVAATFDNTAIALDYQWAQNIINECTVKAHPREAKAFGKLWRLRETPFDVDAGATEYFRAYYTDYDTGERCGAIAGTVVLDNLTYSGASIVATLNDIDAMSAEIKIVNSAGVSQSVNTARLRGDPLIADETISRTREDSTSIATYGRRGEEINSRWVARAKRATRVAQFRVNRFKDPRGEVLSISGKYSKDLQFAECWIGRKIRVIDDQLEHDGNYIIIGEDHQWQPGNNHDVRLYLEPTTTTKVSTTSV